MKNAILSLVLIGATAGAAAPRPVLAQEAGAPAVVELMPAFAAEAVPPLAELAERLEQVRAHYTGVKLRLLLAAALAVQETAIGIEPPQQPAWRAYTKALLALVPERERVLALIGDVSESPEGPKAFGRAEALADTLIAYSAKAQALRQSIDALRATLTPAQLEAARVPRLRLGAIAGMAH